MKKNYMIYIYAGIGVIVLIIIYIIVKKIASIFQRSPEKVKADTLKLTYLEKDIYKPNFYKKVKPKSLLKTNDFTKHHILGQKNSSLGWMCEDFKDSLKGVGTNNSLFFATLGKVSSKIIFNQILTEYGNKFNRSLMDDINNDLNASQINQFYNYIDNLPNGY